MLSSLSEATYRQYDNCIKSWFDYCNTHDYDYFAVSVPIIIHFLTTIFDRGVKYGTINSHKSALSLILGNIVNDERIRRFMKGVYRLRPITPKYNFTWDPNIVLNYLAQKFPNDNLNLETLSKKTITLLALVTAHRVQTFALIKINNITVNYPDNIIIRITDLTKTSKPNSVNPVLRLPFFNSRPQICPATCLQTYINKTSTLRRNNFLFISHKLPHSKVSSQTLSRWIKDTLHSSGIDISIFSAHSTRHAATSSANKLGVNIDLIRKTAGWTASSSVFAKFYNKEIVTDPNQFANTILSRDL